MNQQIFLNSCNENPDVIREYYSEGVVIFPNPTSGILKINCDFNFNTISVVDIYGKIIFHKEMLVSENIIDVDLSNQKAGLYLINLYSGLYKKTVKVILF